MDEPTERRASMPHFQVEGEFLARRGYWQAFAKGCDADDAEQARHWILSELGGCHHDPRRLIRVKSVVELRSPGGA